MDAVPRFREIDTARGIAILMMVLFHSLFDLNFFSVMTVNVATGFWRFFAMATASLFLLIVGVSLVISRARAAPHLSASSLTKKFLLRGAGIFGLGMLVTIATWLYVPQEFVVFGILHLIGISVMLSVLFFRFGKYNILFGLAFIGAGALISGMTGPAILLPLGIHPPGFMSVDYTPFIPWFGAVLAGMGIGELLYGGGARRYAPPRLPDRVAVPLSFLGQHALVIYLVHQPVIIILIGLATGARIL